MLGTAGGGWGTNMVQREGFCRGRRGKKRVKLVGAMGAEKQLAESRPPAAPMCSEAKWRGCNRTRGSRAAVSVCRRTPGDFVVASKFARRRPDAPVDE